MTGLKSAAQNDGALPSPPSPPMSRRCLGRPRLQPHDWSRFFNFEISPGGLSREQVLKSAAHSPPFQNCNYICVTAAVGSWLACDRSGHRTFDPDLFWPGAFELIDRLRAVFFCLGVQRDRARAFGMMPTSIEVRSNPAPDAEVKINVLVGKPGLLRRS